jgi:CRP/FNR family cyclic AMP-dependent transcriptional regulator
MLQNIAFFRGLTPAELEKVAGALHLQTFAPNTGLFSDEQPGEVAYIIVRGAVKVYIEQPNGRNVILAILGPGEIVGEMSLIDHLARSAAAITLEECTTLWLNRTDFWGCLESVPALNYNLARILSRRLRLTNAHIQSLAALDLYGRVARQIVVFAREYGEPPASPPHSIRIPFRLTQGDLSSIVGASRGRVNQALVSFKERNFIAVDAQYRITVLNMKALEKLCE